MECFHCKGSMIKSYAPFSTDRNSYHISWESIPAWVCTQCGEAFFEENEINYIQKTSEEKIYKSFNLSELDKKY